MRRQISTLQDRNVLIIITGVGFLSSMFGFLLLNGYSYNFGKQLAGVFVPPFLSVLYLTFAATKHDLSSKHLLLALASYGVQILPFAPLFFQVFRPTGQDDFSRYYLYAKNMVDSRTLWGGDKLFFAEAGYHYVTQPGYRYLVYLELLLFGNLSRLVQFFNIGLYITAVFCFQKTIKAKLENKQMTHMMLLLVLLSTPYAVKNLLMGLPEWFTVLLLQFTCYFYLMARQSKVAVLLLGLVPFFRQNLLIAVLLLWLVLLWRNRERKALFFIFLAVLLLPLYHNLYYAGQWRFFVDVFELPFLKENGNNAVLNFALILNNLLHYIGMDVNDGKIGLSFVAALFLPYSLLVYFFMVMAIARKGMQSLFIAITISVAVPVILLGTAYYPRFEFVNVYTIMAAFLLLSVQSQNAGANSVAAV